MGNIKNTTYKILICTLGFIVGFILTTMITTFIFLRLIQNGTFHV